MKNLIKKGYSLFVMRLIIVAIFFYHGLPKAIDWTMAADKFQSMGFPGMLGPIVGIAEIVAGFFLLIGLWTRASATVLGVIIVVAIAGVQIPGAVEAGKLLVTGLERDLLIFAGLLSLISYGAGSLSISSTEV